MYFKYEAQTNDALIKWVIVDGPYLTFGTSLQQKQRNWLDMQAILAKRDVVISTEMFAFVTTALPKSAHEASHRCHWFDFFQQPLSCTTTGLTKLGPHFHFQLFDHNNRPKDITSEILKIFFIALEKFQKNCSDVNYNKVFIISKYPPYPNISHVYERIQDQQCQPYFSTEDFNQVIHGDYLQDQAFTTPDNFTNILLQFVTLLLIYLAGKLLSRNNQTADDSNQPQTLSTN